jgi:hypothetical protein
MTFDLCMEFLLSVSAGRKPPAPLHCCTQVPGEMFNVRFAQWPLIGRRALATAATFLSDLNCLCALCKSFVLKTIHKEHRRTASAE